MASIISHPIIPLTIGLLAARNDLPWRVIALGMLCSILPDLDVIGFKLGIEYASPFGHRGFTHSLIFSAFLASLTTLYCRTWTATPSLTWLFLFISTVSHGLIDALTNGGLGVAFLWPFSEQRYFFPMPGIQVSPIGIKNFFNQNGLDVLRSEFLSIWLPCLLLIIITKILRIWKHPSHD